MRGWMEGARVAAVARNGCSPTTAKRRNEKCATDTTDTTHTRHTLDTSTDRRTCIQRELLPVQLPWRWRGVLLTSQCLLDPAASAPHHQLRKKQAFHNPPYVPMSPFLPHPSRTTTGPALHHLRKAWRTLAGRPWRPSPRRSRRLEDLSLRVLHSPGSLAPRRLPRLTPVGDLRRRPRNVREEDEKEGGCGDGTYLLSCCEGFPSTHLTIIFLLFLLPFLQPSSQSRLARTRARTPTPAPT